MKVLALILAILAIVCWFAIGNPKNDIASVVWANSPAPWESVTGFYYPDKSDLSDNPQTQDSGTLGNCRDWAAITITASVDPTGQSSTYACGISCANPKDASSCRLLVK
ncbi:MAG: hypothetical protein JWM39_552 [Parcubacteria group bacterium]|jgi:hypothetical protein|nr:hypothetical protein [Parcubacteria group bacterium]